MSTTRKICTIIGGDKGGVGKTEIAVIKPLVYHNARLPIRVIEIDNQRKLSSVLGAERVNLSLSAVVDIQAVIRNRHAAETFYNPVYVEWTKGTSITDLGANVTTPLLSWFRQCEIGELAAEDNIHFRFVACASPDEQAIRSALTAVTNAMDTLGTGSEYFVVLNDLTGTAGFEPYKGNPHYRELLALQAARRVSILNVPFCDSLLHEYGRARGLDPLQTVIRGVELADAAGLDQVSTRVHTKKMANWLRTVQAALEPVLAVEEPAHAASAVQTA